MSDTPVLELRGVTKRFGAVEVLHEVDFYVNPGEVMALVGDNGAGKSTLIKCVAGIHHIDGGEVLFDGTKVTIHGPKDAADLGIEVVYQDLALADNLDVVQNMFLGREELDGSAPRRDRDGVALAEDARGALGHDDPLGPPDRREPVRRPAPVGRGRQGRDVELAGGDPRRAHGGARRRADPAGARPGQAARRAGPRRRDRVPQPSRRVRGGRLDHGPAPRQGRGGVQAHARRTSRRSSRRSPPASSPRCPARTTWTWSRRRHERGRGSRPGTLHHAAATTRSAGGPTSSRATSGRCRSSSAC